MKRKIKLCAGAGHRLTDCLPTKQNEKTLKIRRRRGTEIPEYIFRDLDAEIPDFFLFSGSLRDLSLVIPSQHRLRK